MKVLGLFVGGGLQLPATVHTDKTFFPPLGSLLVVRHDSFLFTAQQEALVSFICIPTHTHTTPPITATYFHSGISVPRF